MKEVNVQIEKGIPMPEAKRTGAMVKILEQMEVGDSFIATDQVKFNSLYQTARRLNMSVAKREVEGGEVRIWRTQ